MKPSTGHDTTRKNSKLILPLIPKESAPQFVQGGKRPAAEKNFWANCEIEEEEVGTEESKL